MRTRLFAAALGICLLFAAIPQGAGAQPQPPVPESHEGALTPPPPPPSLSSSDSRGPSQYMAGDVAVRVILPESTGSEQNWSQAQIEQIRSQVQVALDWWAARLPLAHLTFSVRLQVLPTTHEPITYGLAGEGLWISDVLGSIGFTTGSYFDQAYAADSALRDELGADWATTIFVVNSHGRSGGTFADGYFAYAYINGPFMVLTSDVGSYGASNLGPVVAHELGHIFGALDQYASARVSCTRTSGYLNTPSTNSQYNGCGTNLPSIMIEVLNAFRNGSIDSSALAQIGYRDSDGDGTIDPLDTTPELTLSSIAAPTPGAHPLLGGQSRDIPFVSTYQPSISINQISAVEYRVDEGVWLAATAADGVFDSSDELFTAEIPLYDGQYLVDIRARNSAGNESAIVSHTVTVSQVGPQPDYHPSLPAFTAQTDVQIQLGAPASTQSVQVSTDPTFSGVAWQAYRSTLTFPLVAGDGAQTLYVRYRDAAGRDSLPFTLNVVLDTTPPKGSATYDPHYPDQLALNAYDIGAGVAEVGLLLDNNEPIWVAYNATVDLGVLSSLASNSTPPDTSGLQVLFRDAVGNTSVPTFAFAQKVYIPLIISR